jgi:hypothetical protein
MPPPPAQEGRERTSGSGGQARRSRCWLRSEETTLPTKLLLRLGPVPGRQVQRLELALALEQAAKVLAPVRSSRGSRRYSRQALEPLLSAAERQQTGSRSFQEPGSRAASAAVVLRQQLALVRTD